MTKEQKISAACVDPYLLDAYRLAASEVYDEKKANGCDYRYSRLLCIAEGIEKSRGQNEITKTAIAAAKSFWLS